MSAPKVDPGYDQEELARIAKMVKLHLDIDIMNAWIASCNDSYYMLLCGGIQPKFGLMKYISYPEDHHYTKQA